LSGYKEAILRAIEKGRAGFEDADGVIYPAHSFKVKWLDVSAPFHCSLLETARANFADALSDVVLATPRVPVIANVTATPYEAGSAAVRSLLVQHIVAPVKWSDSLIWAIRHLANDNDALHDTPSVHFDQFGPSQVLLSLAQQMCKSQSLKLPVTLKSWSNFNDFSDLSASIKPYVRHV